MTETLKRTTIAAWLIMLAASLLPNIIGLEVMGQALPWLWIKSGLLAALLVAGFVLPWLKPLRPYMVILLLILAANSTCSRPSWPTPPGGRPG